MKKQLVAFTAFSVLSLSFATGAHAAETDLSTVNQKADFNISPEMKAAADKKATDIQARLAAKKSLGLEAADPLSKRLGSSGYIAQPDSTTCGPTSAHNLLLNWGTNVALDTLKSDLGYAYPDGTGFGSLWTTTLNKYSNSSFYVLQWTPSESTLFNGLVADIVDNHPFILDVHMSTANGALVGYPAGTEYWHYVTANGYGGNAVGAPHTGDYFDPYNGRTGTFGQHSMTTSSLVPLVKDRGIVY